MHMDGLTFIDHLIGHLAWPLAAIGVIVFLSLRHRGAINALIHRVQKAKAGLFEIELAEAKASANRAHLPPPAVLLPSKTPKDQTAPPTMSDLPEQLQSLFLTASFAPRTAVMQAQHLLNAYAWDASQRLDPEPTPYPTTTPPVQRATAVGLLAPEQADVLDRLRHAALRAYDPDEELTPGQAIDYVLVVTRLIEFMRGRFKELSKAAKGSE
jgi:hypothetical protein